MSQLFDESEEIQSAADKIVSIEYLIRLQRLDNSLLPVCDVVKKAQDKQERSVEEICKDVFLKEKRIGS